MATLTVGSGEEFQTIAAAVAASQDGDVIQVQAGTYVNDFAEISSNVTLEGVGGMVNMVANGPIPNGKAILITDTDVTIDHFEFSGATVTDGNGAGIRYQGGNLTIDNSSFHDNQDGLLAADDPNGSITIQNSEFYDNGSGNGQTHNLYVDDIGQLTINGSYFHGAIVGHEIKSRAENTTITNSRIQDGPGTTSSYEIDLPNGGNAVIENNVIEQSQASQNPVIISYGEEGDTRADSALLVSGNTILNDQTSHTPTAVRNATTAVATVTNNSAFGITSGQVLSGPGTVSDLTLLLTAPALNTSSSIQTSGASDSSTASSSAGSPSAGSSNPAGTTPITPSPPTGLVLDISEDAWQGDADYTISIDGQQIGGIMTATASHSAGQTQPVVVNTILSPGNHSVSVDFLNDAYDGTPSTDRNLYLDGAILDGRPVSGSTITLLSAGSASFALTETEPPPVPPATTGTNGLVLDVSEDAWQGDAQYTISVDGQQVGGVRTASASHAAGQTQAVPVDVTLSPGAHIVGATFLNDAYGGTTSTDRNLYIDGATLNGQTIAGSTITMLSNGTGTFDPTEPATAPATSSSASANALVLNVSEDAWMGDAQYTISVDGQQVGGVMTATVSHSSGQSQSVGVSSVLAAGSHTVAVTFLNDAYAGTPSTDRNLYVDNATLNGHAITGNNLTLMSNGTASFDLVVPAV